MPRAATLPVARRVIEWASDRTHSAADDLHSQSPLRTAATAGSMDTIVAFAFGAQPEFAPLSDRGSCLYPWSALGSHTLRLLPSTCALRSESERKAPTGRDNALAETVIGLFKTEVMRRRGRWRTIEAMELATFEWVDWFNNRRLLEPIGNIPPAEAEARYYAQANELAMAA